METLHPLKSSANSVHLARSIEQYKAGQRVKQDMYEQLFNPPVVSS